ncbi:DUF1513 domain-containing protein [Pseudomonas lalucatii]|nr:DUF1513 domain-containing protein [Pseudomonas lalucatii]
MHRRAFLGLGAAALAAGALGGWQLIGNGHAPLLLSARDDSHGRHFAVGYRLDGSRAFATEVGERCHDVVAHPHLPLALFVGRRPATHSYLIDTRDGRLLQALAAAERRHFYGHAVFHRDGEWLYATENDTAAPGRGVIGVYRLQDGRLQRRGELSSQGVGPHQLLWLPDGETLVVANGGIRTEADSRVAMNLDAMESSLVLLARDGSLLSKEQLPQRQNSVRHLAVAGDGTIVSGQQYMGDAADNAALLAIKRPGQAFQAFPLGEPQRLAMQQYTASLAIHDELRLLALTAPGQSLLHLGPGQRRAAPGRPLPDCAGVGAVSDGFVVSSGVARCRLFDCRAPRIVGRPLQLPAGLWDNHLRLA